MANRSVIMHYHLYFYLWKEILLWHTLLVMAASAVDHALLSALFQLFLREILSTLSMKQHASTAVLAQLSALFQQSLRADQLNQKLKSSSSSHSKNCSFFIWILRYVQISYTAEAT